MSIKDKYQIVLREIMRDYGITPGRPWFGHRVPPNATFNNVVQYADYYVGKGNDEQKTSAPHYRYRRYLEVLDYLEIFEIRKVHIDVGGGEGLFSWAFLDWMTMTDVEFTRVNLFGYDYSNAMIRLAQEIGNRLRRLISDYPTLHYFSDITHLLDGLEENHQSGMDYIITFGHVLAQAHNPDAIGNFTKVIVHILKMMDNKSDCIVAAVDARNSSIEFGAGWDLLRKSVESQGIQYEPLSVRATPINDHRCARAALIYRR